MRPATTTNREISRPTYATPEPISVSIEIPIADVTLNGGDRTETVVDVRPSRPDNDEDVRAAEQIRVDFADGRLTVKGPRGRAWLSRTRGSVDVSVELRLRSGEPDFVVMAPAPDEPLEPLEPPAPPPPPEPDDAATARINLRLPEHLKAGVEQAAARERLSVNAWLVRTIASALSGDDPGRPRERRGRIGQSYTGWVR